MLEIRDRDTCHARARAGELVLLIGRSGGGKSRTLRRLAGLSAWPEGVRVQWRNKAWPPRRPPPVYFVPDLWPPVWLGRTLGEELGFGLTKSPAQAELDEVLAKWGLATKLAKPTEALARHEAARACCAAAELAARAQRAELVLLDQLLDALALPAARACARMLAQMAAAQRIVVILATAHPRAFAPIAMRIWRAHPRAPREITCFGLGSRP